MTHFSRGQAVFIFLLGFSLVYLLPLGLRPMIVPDEVRYAEISREMIATGDWIVPRLNGLRYFEKPVMGYWLNALSMLAFGQNSFALRFPTAMAAGLSALMVWLLMRRLTGAMAASLAAVIFLTCFEVVGIGVFSVLDGMLAMFITLAMATFYFACNSQKGSWRERGLLALFGLWCGMAFLTKGFLAFAVPVVSVVPFLLWERRWKDIFRMAGIPIVTATLVSLPWAMAVHLKEPDFWNYFFWQEHVKRFMAEDAQHKSPFWTYFLAFPVAALPWSVLIPASLRNLHREQRGTPLFRYALCWFMFPLLFFSAASGKLLTYILPCFPPFAILLTLGLGNYFGKEKCKAINGGIITLGVLFATLLLGLIVIQITRIGGFIPYFHVWKTIAAAGVLAAYLICLGKALKSRVFESKMVLIVLGSILFLTTAQLVLPDDTLKRKSPQVLLVRNATRIQPETVLVSMKDPLRAVCWFFKRSDVYQVGSPGELEYGFGYAQERHRLLDEAQFLDLINRHEPGRVVFVLKAKHYRRWKDRLPPPVYVDTSGPIGYVLAQY